VNRGTQLHGPDPTKKRNKKGNTTKTKTHTTPNDFLKNLWLMVKRKKKREVLFKTFLKPLKTDSASLKRKV